MRCKSGSIYRIEYDSMNYETIYNLLLFILDSVYIATISNYNSNKRNSERQNFVQNSKNLWSRVESVGWEFGNDEH